ncbi:unnamed protein product [Brassicogethes aeneus]|uniref:DHHA2 domain-containing protein n=1 Tax=Brassicogethes aeneus TaxID=1431903 RepID=A0A9P0ASA6_BRAAE|nr:unnamed protein product [Brassicogethes aeneus]
MDHFHKFLESSKNCFSEGRYNDIILIIGNESCDLDSTVSSLVLSFFIHLVKYCNMPQNALTLPVINISKESFKDKTENNFLLKKFNIDLNNIVFRDEINFEELINTKSFYTILVDHHMLSLNDKVLKNTVKLIYDHRPKDSEMDWDTQKVSINIEQVGSCATLISDLFLKTKKEGLCYELAYLLYATIIFDTVALKVEFGRTKELDIKIAEMLENSFKFSLDRDDFFKELKKVHMDVSHLSPRQILLRDLKVVNDIPVPGLPMLVEDFFNQNGTYEEIVKFCDEYKHKIVVLIGLNALGTVRRDVGIYWKDSCKVKEKILYNLKQAQDLKGYNFGFSETSTTLKNVVLLRQENITLSRKQVVPLIKDAFVG